MPRRVVFAVELRMPDDYTLDDWADTSQKVIGLFNELRLPDEAKPRLWGAIDKTADAVLDVLDHAESA